MNGAGFLLAVPAAAITLAAVAAVASLGYLGAPGWVWAAALGFALWGLGAPTWAWALLALFAVVFLVPAVRRRVVTAPLVRVLGSAGILPRIGDTERTALEAGTTWIEGEFFTGKPDLGGILDEPWPELSDRERAFLDGPVEELCRRTTDWEIHQREDLPAETWAFLLRERFLGMAIPEEYGGLGFSANGMRAVVAKLGSRSIPLTVDVMVPNSLGPAELLVHYGTAEQKRRWLPGLARGEEIPCFALTEPDAGSDAASIGSRGEVFRGEDGELYLRLDWEKRYITLAAVATVLGLAFRLRDPENLLGKGIEPGITCALVPTDVEGVVLGRRHDPLRTPFINSPTEGRGVVVPIDAIIGGPEQAGNGWRMLMETLAGGRGIFLPALNAGGGRLAARVAGGYAVVRRQFGLPIGRFEGIQEHLAPIGGLAWLIDAFSTFTCGGVDRGGKPAVASAIVKYQAAEFNRAIMNHAMDILGGKGIALGPNNLLGHEYVAAPIAVTVEGSNVITRSLIVFGQGLIRCHPYALAELDALEAGDVRAFDRTVWRHVGTIVRNAFRAALLSATRGRLARAPGRGWTAAAGRSLAWASAWFALLADVALLTLGGSLKRREKLSGRFADALSGMVLAACALRRFEAEGRAEAAAPFARWAVDRSLAEVQAALLGVVENWPGAFPGALLRGPVAAWLRLAPLGRPPSDRLGKAVAAAMQAPGEARDRLTAGMFLPVADDEPLARLERALLLAVESEELFERVRAAVREGRLPDDDPRRLADEACAAGVLDDEECARFKAAEEARRAVVAVDAFDLDTLPVALTPAGAERVPAG